ncbi:DsrE/DsrF/DrsH-like family protein [Alloprevotella tannerae]|uniref:Pyridine nucleotide-disulfide oxidoreductase n=1 Tax=Alloprevotella tannerae ATCC 51259 TaxID=626522 RepID=C9LGQ6_9BACT|nr:DsrE/DsrF/DrsH-like family protein [Alloprevotella tannerae]EEX71864.1 pyridine nucleotide-disulfide oxidoreductase [Alloprevotella tannerae ATCC 51259]
MKHLIIGGVAGGATAAARIRRIDEQAEIILLEKGPHISYANCGLPYYIGGVIAHREKLFVQTPEAFGQQFNVDVRICSEAIAIHPEKKTVTVRKADDSCYEEGYDRLLLSPGATPVRPPLKGIDLEGIFTLRNVEDTDRIKSYLQEHEVKSAVVVGGGFIGLEMAENLQEAGAKVSIVEMANQVMAPIDFSMASYVHRHLTDKGVDLYLEKGVDHFEQVDHRIRVCLANGENLDADLVLLSIGVRPSTHLATEAGIRVGRGIQVDEYLETSVPDIFAVGDAIEYPHPVTGENWLNYLAGPANRQARIVADNMVRGKQEKYEGSIGTAIAKVFDLTVATTGLPAKRLKQAGIAYASSTTVSAAHAGYYPGSFRLTTKLTFAPQTGRLLGAQCVGNDGVDKRIDQIALIIKQGGTVQDLIRIEQAYAPPFSSAKDPIAIAGYVAHNIIIGAMPAIYWRDIDNLDRNKTLLLDVRTPSEYELGTIQGAINIPLEKLRERLNELPKDKDIVVFCAVGLRGYLAIRILQGHGFKNVCNLSGGYQIYALATAPITNKATPKQQPEISTTKPCISTLKIDACGLQCPGPIMKLKNAMDQAQTGERIEVVATDAGFSRDAEAWCQTTGNSLITKSIQNGYHTVVIEKNDPQGTTPNATGNSKNKTLIMFSDDLDKALATFVLANGAAATGHKVSIFFTFWGLNVIKRERKPKVKKDIFGKMFSWMLPKSSQSLHLSKMSMLGIGDRLMRHIMRKKNISSLEDLRDQARANGVEFIACQMSMDMMGIDKNELIDGVSIGGVATYMQRAEDANVNLFI